jgi:2-C-methyl-D-erythritol 4-phosphate cytidylyltransferase
MAISYSAIVAAGGSSSRFGANKLREKLGGKSVISHSLDLFDNDDDCEEIILAAGPDTRAWIDGNPLLFASPKLKVVPGGASRAESVANAVQQAEARYLAIHDAARPNVHEDLLARVKGAVQPGRGAVPGLALSDTLAYGEESGPAQASEDFFSSAKAPPLARITGHPQRSGLYIIQTPQFFERESYLAALTPYADDTGGLSADFAGFTDDSSLYVAAGHTVVIVQGAPGNIKITTPAELSLLQKLMGGPEKKSKDRYGGLGW